MAKNLYAFLHPQKVENDFVYLERFRNEDGEIEPVEIKALTQKENNELMRKHTKRDKNGNEVFAKESYMTSMVLKSITNIDFTDADLQKAYGVLGEENLISTMFTIGEFATLAQAVTKLCGFDNDINSDIDEAKN